MFKTQTYSRSQSLAAYWQIWASLFLAFARRVRRMEDCQTRAAFQKASELEQYSAFALHQILHQAASLPRARSAADEDAEQQLLCLAQFFVLFGYIARNIKARLLEGRRADGQKMTAAPAPDCGALFEISHPQSRVYAARASPGMARYSL